jgi:hypothetical protein
MIKWIYKPEGACPVQAEGYFRNKYFYFRSRHNASTIEFCDSKTHWTKGLHLKYYVVAKTKKPYEAGWFSHFHCKLLIFKGCIMYLLNFKSNY